MQFVLCNQCSDLGRNAVGGGKMWKVYASVKLREAMVWQGCARNQAVSISVSQILKARTRRHLCPN